MKFENVRIVNHNETIENADIFVEDGKIVRIESKPGKGLKTFIPGFIETHIHGFFNNDAMDSAEAVENISKGLIGSGVTSFMPTLMTASWEKVLDSMNNTSKAKSTGAKIAGIHLEGPFISNAKKGAHDPQYIIEGVTKEQVKAVYDASNGMLKRMTWAPEVNDIELIDYMRDLGIVVSIGHTNASAKVAHDAFDHGATAVTHIWNGMSGVVNRTPGVAEAALVEDKVYAELICDLVHVDAETIRFTIKNKTPERVVVISDSIRPAGLPDGEYTSGGQPVIKKGVVIKVIKTQSIAGGAGSIDVGFGTLVKLGYPMEDIVKMTSYNAAINNNLENIAQIKPGFAADFVVLDDKSSIKEVWIDGVMRNDE